MHADPSKTVCKHASSHYSHRTLYLSPCLRTHTLFRPSFELTRCREYYCDLQSTDSHFFVANAPSHHICTLSLTNNKRHKHLIQLLRFVRHLTSQRQPRFRPSPSIRGTPSVCCIQTLRSSLAIMANMATATDASLLAQASALQSAYEAQAPYQPLYPYNGTIETGGTSTTTDLNLFYNVSLIACTCSQKEHEH